MIEQLTQILPQVTIPANSVDTTSAIANFGGPTPGRLWLVQSVLVSSGAFATGPADSVPPGSGVQWWDLRIVGIPGVYSGVGATFASVEGWRVRSHKSLNPPIAIIGDQSQMLQIAMTLRNDTAVSATFTPYVAVQLDDVAAPGGATNVPGLPHAATVVG